MRLPFGRRRPIGPFFADDHASGVYDRLRKGDVDGLTAELRSRSDRPWLVGCLTATESEIPISAFEQLVATERSALTYAMLGLAQVRDAWAIRGAATAEHVNPDSWLGFHESLDQAEATLWEGVQLPGEAAEAWTGLLTTCRGLGGGQENLRQRFDGAHQAEPFHPGACGAMLQGLCEKWGGSTDKMFDFARFVHRGADPSSPAQAVLPLAHYEQAIQLDASNEGYFGDPVVAAELCSAAEAYLADLPNPIPADRLEVLNHFILTIAVIDARSAQLVQTCIDLVDGRMTRMPWAYSTDADGYFRAVVKERSNLIKRFR